MDTTTIQIDKELKSRLDLSKIHPRETYQELIERLMSNAHPRNYDKESLIATIEVLSDPELMRDLREALQEEGGTSLEDVKKELGLEDV